MYASVVLNVPLDRAFTYEVPEPLRPAVERGVLVSVTFNNRKMVGCVLSTADDPGAGAAAEIRAIAGVASPGYRISEELLGIGEFIADYYLCSMGEALASIAITGFRDVRLRPTVLYAPADADPPAELTRRQSEVLGKLRLNASAPATKSALAELAGCSSQLIDKLVAHGCLVETEPVREPREIARTGALELNAEQIQALDPILRTITGDSFGAFLLHGVTGSGKTEVYLQAMAEVLARGRTAICLVPEISLTPQTVDRFERRFGESIGVFHSQQSRTAKLALYHRIRDGGVRIVIGARSAVFAPLPDLGLVVVDEEHDGSYKQGETPRYHARDLAILRARRAGIPVVLGSATPSLESYTNALDGKYSLLKLGARAAGVAMPVVRVLDLSRELTERSGDVSLSEPLVKAVRERIDRGEQSILFLNRRGFSNFLFCPSCKWVAKCAEDDIAMTVHRKSARATRGDTNELDLFAAQEQPDKFSLRCHFCGRREHYPSKCPNCGREELLTIGSGTQRIEEELAARFPDARLLRLDYDTTSGRDAWLRAWNRMESGDADIIVGTQMIAKGLHLEKVTLVGVVLADVGLFIPDFRAEERTFSLLTQVAGRAGRTGAGDVYFQTWMPGHTAVRCATAHDYEAFYREESRRRREAGFPPFSRLTALTISDQDGEKALKAARLLASLLRRASSFAPERLRINGPRLAPLAKLGGRLRYRILLRGERPRSAGQLIRRVLGDSDWSVSGSTRVAIDVDALDLM